jgi:N-acyl homoserine lactone hydrolase
MTALLVRHPKGNLLIDTGAGKNVDAHVKIMPAMMRATTDYTKAITAGDSTGGWGNQRP